MNDAEKIARLREVVEKARDKFVFYGQQHRDKKTADGDFKAQINEKYAAELTKALEDTKGPNE